MTNNEERIPTNPIDQLKIMLEKSSIKEREEKERQEKIKREQREAVIRMAKDAIAMIDGNTKLHGNNERLYLLSPETRTKSIEEEKAKVREKIKKVEEQIQAISGEIENEQIIIDEASRVKEDEEVATLIVAAREALDGKKTSRQNLEETKTQLENSIGTIDQAWQAKDEAMNQAGNDREKFAIDTILAWNQEAGISYEQLADAIREERERAHQEKQSAYEAEIEREIDLFISDVERYMDETQTELFGEFKKLLAEARSDDTGSVKALIREAFTRIPQLMERKTFWGILRMGRKDEREARLIYSKATRAIGDIKDRYNALQNKKNLINNMPELLKTMWARCDNFPQSTFSDPGSILFSGNSYEIERLIPYGVGKEKKDGIVHKLQVISGKIKKFNNEIEAEFNRFVLAIYSPEEGILQVKTSGSQDISTLSALRNLMSACERN